MNALKLLLKAIYSLYAGIIFACLTIINVIPIVFVALAFGKIKGGNLVYFFCKWWAQIWFWLIGIRHEEIYEAPHNRSRHFIFVANHISYMDIPPIVLAIKQPYRVLGKYEMVKVPIFGLIYRAAVVLVDRSSPAKRARSVRALKTALSNNISIFLFPEGTFNLGHHPLKHFYDGAFRIAIETETPIKPILFVDTLERMHYSSVFSMTPGKCRTVFLEEIPVKGYTIHDIALLKEKVYAAMDAGLRRYRTYPDA